MPGVVTDACIKCKHMDCVEVCPVDAFYEGENMLVISQRECVDCGCCRRKTIGLAKRWKAKPGWGLLMKETIRLVLFVFAIWALPSATIAVQVSARPQPPNHLPRCELRIITAKGLSVSDSTSFKGGGVIGDALSGLYKKPDYQVVTEAANLAIGPDGQEKLIKANLGKLPERLAGYDVTFERGGPEVLAAYKNAKQSLRVTTSRASCVAEISVVGIAYIRTSVSRGIDCLFMFREFGVAPTATRVTIYANGAPARAFPAKTPDGVQAGNEELSAAFSKMFLALLQKLSSAK